MVLARGGERIGNTRPTRAQRRAQHARNRPSDSGSIRRGRSTSSSQYILGASDGLFSQANKIDAVRALIQASRVPDSKLLDPSATTEALFYLAQGPESPVQALALAAFAASRAAPDLADADPSTIKLVRALEAHVLGEAAKDVGARSDDSYGDIRDRAWGAATD